MSYKNWTTLIEGKYSLGSQPQEALAKEIIEILKERQ